jgi:hypothetical protein
LCAIPLKILVLGKAKTGTTIVAKTIQANLSRARLTMEPESPDELLRRELPGRGNSVSKVIFEHWNRFPSERSALVHNELIDFDRIVCIVRDPRDELISRLIYYVFPWSENHPGNDQKIQSWIELVRQKEQDPSSLSLLDLASGMDSLFGGKFLTELNQLHDFSGFLSQLPDNAFLLRYEDFVRGKAKPLENYLGFPLEKEASSRRFRYTKRTASLNNWKQFLLQQDINYLKSNFGNLIEQFGYTDWNLETPSSLPVEHYSGYIEKLLAVPKRPGWMQRLVK